jgi:transaldolase/glucose-6-phosphate isomerase
LFSREAYLRVAHAYIEGLEARVKAGRDVTRIASVASFFVSRIDTQIDRKIDAKLAGGKAQDVLADKDVQTLRALKGRVAIANAKLAYQDYLELSRGERWQALAAQGAQPQRLLWASTGTKNPDYSDVLYIAELIGPATVNTMPPKTMDAFRDHGTVRESLTEDVAGAAHTLAEAERLGLDLKGVTDRLVVEGVRSFADAADKLYGAVARKRIAALGDKLNAHHLAIPEALAEPVKTLTETARAEGWSRRLWAGDASLWTGADEAKWIGWLPAARGERIDIPALEAFAGEVAGAGFIHAVLLGMGGSSLGPEVLAETFGSRPGHPQLLVLDTTQPDQIAHIEAEIDVARTLFIVASKSGSTLEPDVLHRHFFALTAAAVGEAQAGAHFVAITDPGSKLEATAKEQGFRRTFLGDPAIGGRYSVLSNFGMVPAAVIGVDVKGFMASAQVMTRSCGPSAPPALNPGLELGLLLGAAAKAGRDKLTILASHGLSDVGFWLEQLVAESTGKHGLGIVPLAGEPAGAPRVYGDDRVFAYLRLDSHGEPPAGEVALDAHVRELEEAGHPVVRLAVSSRDTLGQEFIRWEVATAIAGAVIGIDPFDQPDVEASKIKARELTDAYEKDGSAPAETPILVDGDLALYADPADVAALEPKGGKAIGGWLGEHFARAGAGDYIGLLAWIDRDPAHVKAIDALRTRLRDHTKCATVVGFGPRFLHSTGQAYKGGPNSGVFLQITADPAHDRPIPGRKASFGVIAAAQARGDLAVLAERGRRLLRVHITGDVGAGLKRLAELIDHALV